MTIRNSLMVEQPGFDQVLEDMRASVAPSILSLCTADPDIVTIGVSPEAFWTGPENQAKLITEFEQEAGGRPVVTSADAITAALEQLGSLSRVGVITPYLQLGDDTVRRFFDDRGYEVIAIEGMGAETPASIAEIGPEELRATVNAVNKQDIEVIIQVGTNVAMSRFAAAAELFLDKPVLSNNAVLYWHALRRLGVNDQFAGFGRLFHHL
nr:arylmalonate decarboxylase [Brevibacterium luteolum]